MSKVHGEVLELIAGDDVIDDAGDLEALDGDRFCSEEQLSLIHI